MLLGSNIRSLKNKHSGRRQHRKNRTDTMAGILLVKNDPVELDADPEVAVELATFLQLTNEADMVALSYVELAFLR